MQNGTPGGLTSIVHRVCNHHKVSACSSGENCQGTLSRKYQLQHELDGRDVVVTQIQLLLLLLLLLLLWLQLSSLKLNDDYCNHNIKHNNNATMVNNSSNRHLVKCSSKSGSSSSSKDSHFTPPSPQCLCEFYTSSWSGLTRAES